MKHWVVSLAFRRFWTLLVASAIGRFMSRYRLLRWKVSTFLFEFASRRRQTLETILFAKFAISCALRRTPTWKSQTRIYYCSSTQQPVSESNQSSVSSFCKNNKEPEKNDKKRNTRLFKDTTTDLFKDFKRFLRRHLLIPEDSYTSYSIRVMEAS